MDLDSNIPGAEALPPPPLPVTQESLDAIFAIDSAGFTEDELEGNFLVSLACFEGPLDLLLHLIRREQINIYDIPIAKICQSYLDTLSWMRQYDLNVAGEFMVMAATLAYIKSQTLLPKDAEDEEEDPRMPLVQQLLEYERFKKAAQRLDEMPWLNREYYTKPPTAYAEVVPVEALATAPIEPVETFSLLLALKAATDRTTKKTIEIATDPVSIREKVYAVTELVRGNEWVDFSRLLPLPRSQRHDVIVSFLAILELAKLKFIEILQGESYGPIQIRPVRPMEELNLALLDQY